MKQQFPAEEENLGTAFRGVIIMVNWKEDVAFLYCLFMLISLIVAYFSLSESMGGQTAAIAMVLIGVVEGVFGFILFKSGRAAKLWSRSGKSILPQ